MTERDEHGASAGPGGLPAPSAWAAPGSWPPPAPGPAAQPADDVPPTAPGPTSADVPPVEIAPAVFEQPPGIAQTPRNAVEPSAQQSWPPGGPQPSWGSQPAWQPGPPPVPPPAGGPWRPPRRLEAVPGTPFAVAYLDVPRTTSGPSIGALATGIGSLLVMVLAGCFGAIGAQRDSGVLAGGAFGILAGLLGAAGVGLGVVGLRQVRRLGGRGRGLAISGIACGGAGMLLTVAIMLTLLATD